ncbi:PREDICTED: type IV inositol polyphosphate 5-phosphatase 3-like isoform X2 [Nelumbo nucifera]|uniref:Type IV inositol polyphosphate 5-phosphatase 3-like isoform X2 n=1 Tax=Nelumbo nucifera TaxID=4432 RepID=A0A1U8AQQ2_NELNU|nr:PREDICTED: type IV inositol polyphosphate 5-phosphatase 3-like isoform X2 [Nelumbo nucifera]
MKQSPRKQSEWSWAELCCFGCSCLQLFWPRVVLRKWLNITTEGSDYSADTDEDSDNDFDLEESYWGKKGNEFQFYPNGTSDTFPRLRRQNSETLRSQYIDTKELKICIGTWNVGGKLPPDDLDIKDWLDMDKPADIYVLGFQEIVPLNAGNIFGAEDSRPVPKWESIIRETLNRIPPVREKFKCYSDPPSPSRFKPSAGVPDIEDEILPETDSDSDEIEQPVDKECDHFDEIVDGPTMSTNQLNDMTAVNQTGHANAGSSMVDDLQKQFPKQKRLDRLNCFSVENSIGISEASFSQQKGKLAKTLSGRERIGLSWPEPPMELLAKHVFNKQTPFKSVKSFGASKSLRLPYSFKSTSMNWNYRWLSETALLAKFDREPLLQQKKRSPFVRIVSKQMVGIFLSIWVRRSLRRHIQNLKVSTVGVGVMGYIGNKGSISVSMSIYQTLFCFICSHLTAGEKEGDELKRNADVQEIHRRTNFHSVSGVEFPKSIHDHERIIWFGDLNYRINLSYEKTLELISKNEWSELAERDQLLREIREGHTFGGWIEGTLNFPPTYKYEDNSEKYCGEDPKAGKRTPAWCDRVLAFGNGMRLLTYKRTEQMLSDHRPVTAIYMAEVEVFCHKKLQRALTLTDAELKAEEVMTDIEVNSGMNRSRFGEDI